MSKNSRLRRGALLLLVLCSCGLLMGSALIDPAKVNSRQSEYTTVQVELGTVHRTLTSEASVQYPVQVEIRNKLHAARVADVNLVRTEVIEAGTVLGRIASESSASDLEQAKLSLQRAQDELANGIKDREEAIRLAQSALSGLQGTNREIARLELQKLQIALMDFTISQQRQIDTLEEEIEKKVEQSLDQEVIAPITGGISYFSYIAPGDSLSYNQVLLTLASPFPHVLRMEDSEGEWRYGMPVTVEYGPRNNRNSCTGRVVAADNILPHESRSGYAYVALDQEIDPRALTMLTVKGALYHLENVPVIPKRASQVSGGDNIVSLIEGSSIANRHVNLALTSADGSWVVQGLTPGQTVILD